MEDADAVRHAAAGATVRPVQAGSSKLNAIVLDDNSDDEAPSTTPVRRGSNAQSLTSGQAIQVAHRILKRKMDTGEDTEGDTQRHKRRLDLNEEVAQGNTKAVKEAERMKRLLKAETAYQVLSSKLKTHIFATQRLCFFSSI